MGEKNGEWKAAKEATEQVAAAVTAESRWIQLEDVHNEMTDEELNIYAKDWITHMNEIVWGEYELTTCTVSSEGKSARFEVTFKRPKR